MVREPGALARGGRYPLLKQTQKGRLPRFLIPYAAAAAAAIITPGMGAALLELGGGGGVVLLLFC